MKPSNSESLRALSFSESATKGQRDSKSHGSQWFVSN